MKKMFCVILAIVLSIGVGLFLFSCGKAKDAETDGTNQTGTDTEKLDPPRTEAPETNTPETDIPETDIPETEPDDEEPRPLGTYARGVNVNGLEDPNNIYKLLVSPRVLKNEATYASIKEQGFDHVRIPVPFHLYYDEETGSFDEKAMEVVDVSIDLAIAKGLGVLLDFHGWYEFDVTNGEDKARFTDIWILVAQRYKDKSELLMFELINEPRYIENTATLINFELEVVEAIRRTNPTRRIVLAVPDANGPWMLHKINIPDGYENIALAVHIYEPGDFTHQGCTWAGKEAGKQVRLNAEYLNSLNKAVNDVKTFVDRTGIQVMITEVGMNVALAHEDDTDLYIRILMALGRDYNIPVTWWSYDGGDFGLYIKGSWRTKVLDALFGR